MVEKIAVAGAGLMGYWHSRFAKGCGAQVEAVVDVNQQRATKLKREVTARRACTDFDEILAIEDISVVHICTPPDSHVDLIKRCLNAGKHVLVEKPLAPDGQSTREILSLAQEKKLLVNAIHQFPFQRGFNRLLQHTSSLGAPVHVDFTTCSAGGEGKSFPDRKKVMLEILPHPASLFFRLFSGRVAADAFKVLRHTPNDLEITAPALEFGASILISLRGRPTRNELTYIGDSGSAYVDLFHGYSLFEEGTVSRSAKIFKPLRFGMGMLVKSGGNLVHRAVKKEPAYPGLRELIARFYEAVDTGSEAPISSEEMLYCAQVSDLVRAQTQ